MSDLHVSLKLPVVVHPTVQVGILFCNEAGVILLHPHHCNLMTLLNPRCQNSSASQMSI